MQVKGRKQKLIQDRLAIKNRDATAAFTAWPGSRIFAIYGAIAGTD
jgi:hypothetical protein